MAREDACRRPAAGGIAAARRALERVSGRAEPARPFGIPLELAMREEVRRVLAGRGIRPIREDDRYWVDKYDSAEILSGSSELAIGYTARDSRLAIARYRFPPFFDGRAAARIADMVTREHGPPNETPGPGPAGRFEYRWFPGDVAIRFHRDAVDAPAYLTFEGPEIRRQLDEEMAQAQPAGGR